MKNVYTTCISFIHTTVNNVLFYKNFGLLRLCENNQKRNETKQKCIIINASPTIQGWHARFQ